MTISTNANGGVAQLNLTTPNVLADQFRAMQIGSFLRSLPIPLRQQVPQLTGVYPYTGATLAAIQLPDDAKANQVLRCYARAGTGTAGELTPKATAGNPYTTPTTGTVGVSPSGDIVFLGSDVWTNVDVVYLPEKYDVAELTLPVVPGTGVMTLPAAITAQGVVFMLEAQALVGTTVGTKIVLAPSTAPSTGNANLNVAKTQVLFAVADAVSSARVKLGLCNATDANAFLETAGIFAV
jgi:hypothetical protein